MGFQEEQKTLDKVKEIMTTLQGEPSVSILYDFDDAKVLYTVVRDSVGLFTNHSEK